MDEFVMSDKLICGEKSKFPYEMTELIREEKREKKNNIKEVPMRMNRYGKRLGWFRKWIVVRTVN